jgi:hypothetical protein
MIVKLFSSVTLLVTAFGISACAPTVIHIDPLAGSPGTIVNVSMEYLVGWPRVEIGGYMMDWPQLNLIAADPSRKDVPGTELVWIEDKILQFRIPELAPGEYQVISHVDKGPPGYRVYSAMVTPAYLVFPPVWPFVLRSNEASITLRVLPREP